MKETRRANFPYIQCDILSLQVDDCICIDPRSSRVIADQRSEIHYSLHSSNLQDETLYGSTVIASLIFQRTFGTLKEI